MTPHCYTSGLKFVYKIITPQSTTTHPPTRLPSSLHFPKSQNMANPKPALLVLLLSVLYLSTITESAPASSAASFIRASCSATTYPPLCVQSLSAFASSIQNNPRQLAQTALSVSLARAQSTRTFVYKLTKFKGLKPREIAAIKDCLEEVDDTVDRLGKSMKELKSMGKGNRQEFQWHLSNIETWVSAALTDENTCADGFAGKALNGKVKSSIKNRIVNVAQVTSNALALINKFATKM